MVALLVAVVTICRTRTHFRHDLMHCAGANGLCMYYNAERADSDSDGM